MEAWMKLQNNDCKTTSCASGKNQILLGLTVRNVGYGMEQLKREADTVALAGGSTRLASQHTERPISYSGDLSRGGSILTTCAVLGIALIRRIWSRLLSAKIYVGVMGPGLPPSAKHPKLTVQRGMSTRQRIPTPLQAASIIGPAVNARGSWRSLNVQAVKSKLIAILAMNSLPKIPIETSMGGAHA